MWPVFEAQLLNAEQDQAPHRRASLVMINGVVIITRDEHKTISPHLELPDRPRSIQDKQSSPRVAGRPEVRYRRR